tara:strand:- start:89 stop:343 length:255 start_codon:yes stop_codon:yes gene_type:complete
MSTRGVPAPYFPSPPQGYDPTYFSEVMRSFSLFIQQKQNPGSEVIDSLKLLNLKVFENNADAVTGGLEVNDVYKTSTGELRIVI